MKSSKLPDFCSEGEPKVPPAGVSAIGKLRFIGSFDGWNIWEDTGDTNDFGMRFLWHRPDHIQYRQGAWTWPLDLPPYLGNLLALL